MTTATATAANGLAIGAVVARARTVVFLSRLALGILTWVVVCGGLWLGLFALDNVARLPTGLRFPLAVAAAALTLGGLWKYLLRPLTDRRSIEQVALMLERNYGIPENLLINSLQFEETEYGEGQRAFIEETIRAGTLGLAAVSLRELYQFSKVSKWTVLLSVTLCLWGGYVILAPRHLSNALQRYIFSLSDVPPVGSVNLNITPAGDYVLAERDDLQVAVEVAGLQAGDKLASYPELFWKEGTTPVEAQRGAGNRIVMQPWAGRANTYAHTFLGVRRGFAFRLFVRDAYSRSTQITVNPAPRIAESQFEVTPPAYVGGKAAAQLGPPQPVTCLPGSHLAIRVKLDRPADALRWRAAGEVVECKQADGFWRAEMNIKTSGPYEVEVKGTDLDKAIVIANGAISLLADRPPQVEFIQSAMSCSVTPGEKLPLRLRAEDDYGLKDLTVSARPAYGGSTAVTLKAWTFGEAPGKPGRVEETMELVADASIFAPGGKYFVDATCSDFCPDNPPGQAKPILIDVKSVDRIEPPANPALRDVYGDLDRAIFHQKKALDATRTLSTHIGDVWLDMNGKAQPAGEVQKLLDAHRAQILGNQCEVRKALEHGGGTGGTGRDQLVQRLRQLAQVEAVQANDGSFGVGQQEAAVEGLKPTVAGKSFAPGDKPQEVRFQAAQARYVALVLLAPHGWRDHAVVRDLTLLEDGAQTKRLPANEWNIVSQRGGQNVPAEFRRNRVWLPTGRFPFFLVLEMPEARRISGLACITPPHEENSGVKDYEVYLADKAPEFKLALPAKEKVLAELRPLERVQEAIYNELVALKGKEAKKAESEKEEVAKRALGEGLEAPPATANENIRNFKDELEKWTLEHQKNAEKRKQLMDKPPQDFTEKDTEEMQSLIQEKRRQARKLEDLVNDFVQRGMDFADDKSSKTVTRIAEKSKELNDLEQQAAKKAESNEFTYNLDTAATSKAKEIERGTDDVTEVVPTPGSMEAGEDKNAAAYLQELPSELRVTIAELKDKLNDVSMGIEQAGTQLYNSLQDSDGPITPGPFSGTSAAGQMGDMMPDPKQMATGRANVGRAGQSDGQMVGSSAPAIADDKVAMPNRMSNSPMESAKNIDDQSGTETTSTGMGKGTGATTDFGTSGRLPQEVYNKMKATLNDMDNVRTSAEDLAPRLDRHNLPSTDLKMAIHRLGQAEQAMKKGDGVGLRQAYKEAVGNLKKSDAAVGAEIDRRRAEQAEDAKERVAGPEASSDPKGYEEMIGAYFKKVAEQKQPAE